MAIFEWQLPYLSASLGLHMGKEPFSCQARRIIFADASNSGCKQFRPESQNHQLTSQTAELARVSAVP